MAGRERVYTVTQRASHDRGDMPGYSQAFEASDGGRAVAVWHAGDGVEHPHVVQERLVRASCGLQAIRRFRRWLAEGLPGEWLTGSDE